MRNKFDRQKQSLESLTIPKDISILTSSKTNREPTATSSDIFFYL